MMSKKLIKIFDRKFLGLHRKTCELIEHVSEDRLFIKPQNIYTSFSCGEYALRSAAMVEQTFGGITSRLWDDPFEWTLPEELSTKKKIFEYLNEVEKTRRNGFSFFISDQDLYKEIPAPNDLITLFELLLETINKSENLLGRAVSVGRLSYKDSLNH
jgi:hypothetical protein